MNISLPSLLLPKRKHFGLSIGRTSLRGVELNQKKEVIASAEISIPPGTLDGGVIKNADNFYKSLNSFLAQGKFTTQYVAVCFSEIYAFTRIYTLPKIQKKEISEAISWHIQEIIPFSKDEIYYDWRLIEETDSEYRLAVVTIQKKILDPFIKQLIAAGIKPLSFEPGTSAIARLMTLKPQEVVMIIEINRTGAYVTLVEGNKALFTAVVNKRDEDTADTFLTSIAQTIGDTKNYYKKKGVITATTLPIFLTGELANTDWSNSVSQRVSTKAHLLQTKSVAPAFNKAYAAALTEVRPPADEATINLLPETMQNAHDKERNLLFYRALLIRATMGLLIVVLVASAAFIATTMERRKWDRQVSQLSQATTLGGAQNQRLLLLDSQAKNIVALAPLRNTPREKLERLVSLIPEGVSIRMWTYEDNKLIFMLNGVATDRSALLLFKNKLEQSQEFTKISLPLESLEAAQNVTFTITFITKN